MLELTFENDNLIYFDPYSILGWKVMINQLYCTKNARNIFYGLWACTTKCIQISWYITAFLDKHISEKSNTMAEYLSRLYSDNSVDLEY